MPTRHELRSLSRIRLRETEALYDAGLYDGAAYLAGYVVELALKARICKLLGIQDYAVCIKRVTTLKTDDAFVTEMTWAFRTDKRFIPLQSWTAAGIEIPSGILVTSKKVAA